ncbi:MAG: TolC family protein [Calditrichia bacterium]
MKLSWKTIVLICALLTTAGWSQQKLTLKDCIRIALKQNINIITSENLAEIADNNYLSSYSNILPSVSTSFDASRRTIGPRESIEFQPVGIDSAGNTIVQRVSVLQDKANLNSHSFSLSVSQNIFDGGGWWNRIRRGKASKNAAFHGMNAQINQTITTVAQNYLDLLKQEKILEVNQLAVQRSQDNLDKTQKMFEIGSVAKVDVYRARVNLGNDRISQISQRNAVHQARQRLNISLGKDPNEPLEIEKNVQFSFELPELATMLEQATADQPELMRQQMDVRTGELDVAISRSVFVPRVSGFFSYNRSNSEFEKIYNNFDRNWTTAVGVSVDFNLFNGFQDMVNYQNAKIDLKNKRLALEDYKRTLKSDVSTLYQRYRDLQEIVEINQQNLEAAREEYRLAEERYRLGSGTSLDLREAQVNLTDAERILVSAEYDQLIAYTQLQEALGSVQSALERL